MEYTDGPYKIDLSSTDTFQIECNICYKGPIRIRDHVHTYVTSLVADPYEEAFWFGTNDGYIESNLIYQDYFQRYSLWPAHSNSVNHLLINRDGILSVSYSELAFFSRGGLAKLYKNDLGDICDATWIDQSQAIATLGLNSFTLLYFDLNYEKVTRRLPLKSKLTSLSHFSEGILVGLENGFVDMLDPRSLRKVSSINVNSSRVISLDCRGQYLAVNGQEIQRSFYDSIKIFDLRMHQGPVNSINVHDMISWFNFHPVNEHMIYFLLHHNGASIFNFNFHNYHISKLPIIDPYNSSPSLGAISVINGHWAISNNSGCIDLLFNTHAHLHNPPRSENRGTKMKLHIYNKSYNNPLPEIKNSFFSLSMANKLYDIKYSSKSEAREITHGNCENDFNDSNHLFSDIPETSLFLLYKNPIDSKLLKNVKYRMGTRYVDISRFTNYSLLNQKICELFTRYHERKRISKIKIPMKKKCIPKKYADINFNRETQHYFQYIKQDFPGLINVSANSHLNNLIYILYFIPEIHNAAINHLCIEENCIICELGFLFYMINSMIEDNEIKACGVKNLLRAFRQIPLASQLRINEEDVAETSLLNKVRITNSFLLFQLHVEESYNHVLPKHFSIEEKETLAGNKSFLKNKKSNMDHYLQYNISERIGNNNRSNSSEVLVIKKQSDQTNSSPSTIEKLFKTVVKIIINCQKCSKSVSTDQVQFSTPLKLLHNFSRENPVMYSFSSILSNSLNFSFYMNDICKMCNIETFMLYKLDVITLPEILSLSFDFEVFDPFWDFLLYNEDVIDLPKGDNSMWIPHIITIVNSPEYPGKWVVCEHAKSEVKNLKDYYELYTVVSIVTDKGDSHLVTHVLVPENYLQFSLRNGYQRKSWYMFNGPKIDYVQTRDATSIESWKKPCLLYYVKRTKETDLIAKNNRNFTLAQKVEIPPELFFEDLLYLDNYPRNCSYKKLVNQSLLKSIGKLISIDTESIILNSKNPILPHGLARVSIVAMNENEDVVVIMDDYVLTPDSFVSNYLTRYSGIRKGDLSIKNTRHCVMPLKFIYVKIRYLINEGFKFLGHGIINDLEMINIHISKRQIIDTVELYRLENCRRISLKFLSKFVLGLEIQQKTHDSVQDSVATFKLYKKYLELTKLGVFKEFMKILYEIGENSDWKTESCQMVNLDSLIKKIHAQQSSPSPPS